ncbi:50S RIBOSOMAL PROTEIN HLP MITOCHONDRIAL-LIKE ISOFORM X1 [Salix purpurea]|uniref:50S RIBOSOMAL PROTEIN HLP MITOCHONDRIAL-LIKE ISOFORM X1 n=1 Tax=Salix purpurea TaxID=77065 RepID=A0A9Q0T9X4_SALPP|nr:50S RIBOSOMAL PROTEIN HLP MITOCHONDRIAL-LIKE ISOFORM X1 [Salix purpurea]
MSTILKVVDNSGAKKVTCMQSLKGKKGASVAAVMGVRSSFDDNAAVIAGKQGQPKGSRSGFFLPGKRILENPVHAHVERENDGEVSRPGAKAKSYDLQHLIEEPKFYRTSQQL